VTVSTTESIQAAGGDFTTPQAWYDAHDGDITGDGNAPYIGEMAAESFGAAVNMDGSTTDADHYFHLRAQSGDEFDGDFDGSYPSIEALDGSSRGLVVGDDYTIVEHIVVKDASPGGINTHGVQVSVCGNVLLDTIGVLNIEATGSDFFVICAGIHINQSTGPVTIRNCAVGDILATNVKAGQAGQAYGILFAGKASDRFPFYCYNNAIEGLQAVGNGTELARGIQVGSSSDAKLVNNVIGTLVGDSTAGVFSAGNNDSEDFRNNATTDTTGGTNSQDNITPADEFEDTSLATLDLHMKTGGQCEDNGLDLITGGYTNAPTEDCDNEERPAPGTWSIGIDHHVIATDGTARLIFLTGEAA
jgi:hypothetical protein